MYPSKILNRIKLYYFLKFIVHKLNSEIIKSKIVVLTKREKTDTGEQYPECCSLLLECWWTREKKTNVT
jgi:hypothetical protein